MKSKNIVTKILKIAIKFFEKIFKDHIKVIKVRNSEKCPPQKGFKIHVLTCLINTRNFLPSNFLLVAVNNFFVLILCFLPSRNPY